MKTKAGKGLETTGKMDNWTIIYITTDQYRAELARQMLIEKGITAVIMDKKDTSYPQIGHVEVMVEKENRKAAEKLIKEFEP